MDADAVAEGDGGISEGMEEDFAVAYPERPGVDRGLRVTSPKGTHDDLPILGGRAATQATKKCRPQLRSDEYKFSPDARAHADLCTDFDREDRAFSSQVDPQCATLPPRGEADQDRVKTSQVCTYSRQGPTITGPRLFVPDVVYAPSDVDPAEVLHIPDNSQPSQQHLAVEGQERVVAQVRIVSWNVAGISAKRVKTLIAQDLLADVVALQEYPKMPAGWHQHSGERFSGLIYQNYFMYRAVAVLYDAKKFHLKGRRADERGIWLQLQHIGTAKHFWVGSVHLPNNQPRDECKRLMSQFVGHLPVKADAAIALGDYNTHFRWNVYHDACVPSTIESKWGDLRQVMIERGLQQLPPRPDQACTPTFHSRKQNVSKTQIDGVFIKGFSGEMTIAEGSRVEVGTDHDTTGWRSRALSWGRANQHRG